jgi:hypothetical protein
LNLKGLQAPQDSRQRIAQLRFAEGRDCIIANSVFPSKRPDDGPFVPTKVSNFPLHRHHRKTCRSQEFCDRPYGILVNVFMNGQTERTVPTRQTVHRFII